jgi:hypothetical protein
MSRPRAYSQVLVLAVVGGACSPSVEPIVVAPGCPDRPLRGPQQYANDPLERLLADFEPEVTENADGGAENADCTERLYRIAGRDGTWGHGRDLTSQSVTMQPSMVCAARGKCAGHFATSPPTGWGNNWTAYFRSGGGAYDASAYTGVSFWAAFGGDNGPSFAVPFGIVTTDTAPKSSVCGDNCGDDYMKGVTLTHAWQRHVLRFQELAQGGWGTVQTPLRRDQVVGFIVWTKQQCDIWIDDVRFEP